MSHSVIIYKFTSPKVTLYWRHLVVKPVERFGVNNIILQINGFAFLLFKKNMWFVSLPIPSAVTCHTCVPTDLATSLPDVAI